MFWKTRRVRIIFIAAAIICCLCTFIYNSTIIDFQRGNYVQNFNFDDSHKYVVKLFQRDSMDGSLEVTSSQEHRNSQKVAGMQKENIKTIIAYGKHNTSMIGHSKKVHFSKCTYSNCQMKYSNVPGIKYEADAILIQSKNIFLLPPPPRRDNDQVFVLAVRDAFPTLINAIKSKEHEQTRKWLDVFNWTMTFRFDSDILYPYSFIFERGNESYLSNNDYDKIFREKDKDVFWLVSHCHTKSRREEYVKQLNSIINVDIYGGCGKKFSCPKGTKGTDIKNCFMEVARRYKFVLAFENTIYLDYVTEKVFRWFNLDIIVIGRGGTNYSRRFPQGTLIDAADFNSATELGHFLKKLGSDMDRYTTYLKRKSKYYSVGHMGAAQIAYCKLCEYLHTFDTYRNAYTNISSWWAQGWQNGPRTQIKTLGQLEQYVVSNDQHFIGDNTSTFYETKAWSPGRDWAYCPLFWICPTLFYKKLLTVS